MKLSPTFGYTWAIQNIRGGYELCYFAFASKQQLIDEGKPCPTAEIVRVELRPAKKSLRKPKKRKIVK